ncbi:MAG TPA: hypothetical protein VEM36_11950 [Xanthobacteraceae bacterium]|nr:hypothetical protein [Xanthobacteraceae bacterium]
MAVATDVSPAMVHGLAAFAGAGRLYRFGAAYGPSPQQPHEVAAATVEALARRGLVRTARHHADLTEAGVQRLLAGAPGLDAAGMA